MKIRLTCLGIILFAFKFWILADSNITGVLYNQYGKPVSDAEIFINDTHVFKSNEDGSFSIYISEYIENITVRLFRFYAHSIKANFNQKNINLGELYLVPRLLWTDKATRLKFNNYTDDDKFEKKRFELRGNNKSHRYKKWIFHGRSKFYNDEDKLITILKFKKGKLIYSKRNQNKEWHKIIVNMNEKEEIILNFTKQS
jgi:hypothetical protein